MERRIIEKYTKLNKACKQYPPIQLFNIEDGVRYIVRKNSIYDSTKKDYAESSIYEIVD